MTQPRFADPNSTYRILTLVTANDWPTLCASHPAKDWLMATGFEAGLGELRLIPGPQGVAAAIAGLGTPKARARLRFGVAKAVAGLPAGNWALEGALSPALLDETVLAWLLQSYRFDRYRSAKKPDAALLRLPECAQRPLRSHGGWCSFPSQPPAGCHLASLPGPRAH